MCQRSPMWGFILYRRLPIEGLHMYSTRRQGIYAVILVLTYGEPCLVPGLAHGGGGGGAMYLYKRFSTGGLHYVRVCTHKVIRYFSKLTHWGCTMCLHSPTRGRGGRTLCVVLPHVGMCLVLALAHGRLRKNRACP